MLWRVLAAGLFVVVLAGLAGAATALGQSPTPTSVATTAPATPTPLVTPVGCGFFASPTPPTGLPPNPSAPGGPAVPTDLRAELVDDPELASGFAVRLTWQDNADNETCFGVAVRLQGALWGVIGLSPGLDGSTIGPMTLDYVPVFTGSLCYQVYYGNAAGQSYSNEVCVNVEVVAVPKTATPTATPPTSAPTPLPLPPTPLPAGCQGEGPVGTPGTPNPPTNLRAELVPSPELVEGSAIRLTWDDNAADDLCYIIESKVSPEEWPGVKNVGAMPPSWTGPVSVEDIPWRVGTYCYRVSFGNEAGRSEYSNEACVSVAWRPGYRRQRHRSSPPRPRRGPATSTNRPILSWARPPQRT